MDTKSTAPIRRNLESISVDEIKSKVICSKEDIVVISGSIVEGMGNLFSDIDVCVICEELPVVNQMKGSSNFMVLVNDENLSFREKMVPIQKINNQPDADMRPVENTYRHVDDLGTRADVDYVTREHFEELMSRIHKEYVACGENYNFIETQISRFDLRYVHRILTGVVCAGESSLEKVLQKNIAMELSYVLFRSNLTSYSDFQDIIGSFAAQRWDQTLFLIRGHIHKQLQALTHLYGNTNYNPKWVSTYAERISEINEKILPEYRKLIRIKVGDEISHEDYIRQCLDFSDLVFESMRKKMKSNDCGYSPEIFLQLMRGVISRGKVTDPHVLAVLEYGSKPFNENTPPSRDFLNFFRGVAKCSFV
jgi:hypothetical protein